MEETSRLDVGCSGWLDVGVAAQRASFPVCFACQVRPVLGYQFGWDKPQPNINQPWHDDSVVQVAKHGNKIGNQIEWHAEIPNRQTQKNLGRPGSSRVAENPPIHCQLALEGACEIFASLHIAEYSLHHLTRHQISDRAGKRAWLQTGRTSYTKITHRRGARFAASPG